MESKTIKNKEWHYKLAERIVNNLPDWKKKIYEDYYSKNVRREGDSYEE